MIKDPIITAKIHLIKSILKDFAKTQKHNNAVLKNNMRVYTENRNLGAWFTDTSKWSPEQLKRLQKYLDNPKCQDNITALHVYYLKIKGVNKQHTKDDKTYENSYIYKATVKEFEEEFLVSQNSGKEGHHVA